MSKRQKVTAYVELADGTIYEGDRVTVADKIAWERSARINHWDVQEMPMTAGVFMAWHATKARHGLTYEDFVEQAVDADIVTDDPDAEVALDEDPTQTAAITA